MIEWETRKTGSCRSYAEVPAGAQVTAVNGRNVIGFCEECDRPILEGAEYINWGDALTHKLRCPVGVRPSRSSKKGGE
jgi:hypothetical protein